MYENDYLYAVERDGAYLAHYGIKGMKWGVRKARESGNDRALGRQYRKAAKKLAKLEKRATSGKKYARRAVALGAGAGLAGAVAGFGPGKVARTATVGAGHATAGVGNAMMGAGRALVGTRNKRLASIGTAINRAGVQVHNAGYNVASAGRKAGYVVDKWGKGTNLGKSGAKVLSKAGVGMTNAVKGTSGIVRKAGVNAGLGTTKLATRLKNSNVSNNTIARIGAGAIGAGLAGAAGYNAYRAATAKRNARKAAQFRSEMNKAFAGTKYANGNRQGGRRRKRR